MMRPAILKVIPLLIFFLCANLMHGQQPGHFPTVTPVEKKPYKVLTNGKKITIESKTNIKSMLVWTSAGHRMVEQNNLNTPSYSFETSVKEKIYFLMLELVNGKRYTEKIGVK